MDLKLDEGLKVLIDSGKEKGYLTYTQVNDYLPDDAVNPEKLDQLLLILEEQGIELIVDVDSSSLNNGYYNQGPYVTPSDCDKPPCYWNSVVVRIGGDISYCPVQRRSVVNVSDYRTRRAMVNGIPVNWKGTCG